jgi:tetratricopeptide (TPR) repeat protein
VPRRRLTRFLVAIMALALGWVGWVMTRFDPFGRAAAAYDRHDYRSALKAAQNHLNWFPSDRRASLVAARCQTRLRRAAEAEECYRRADPLDLEDAQQRALGLLSLNDPVAATAVFEEILARWPRDALALKRLAAVRMGRQQWRDVLKLADRLATIPSEEVAGHTMAAIGHHELKHPELAVIAGQRVLALDPDLQRMPLPRPLFVNNLALDLIALGRTDEARQQLMRALESSRDAGLMELLGLTYFQQGATADAERCWREAENWDPDNADVCLDLGRLALSRKRWDEAVEFLKRAADRSTNAVEPLYNLSQVYRMRGDNETAEHYRRLSESRRQSRPRAAGGTGTEPDPKEKRDRRAADAAEPAP